MPAANRRLLATTTLAVTVVGFSACAPAPPPGPDLIMTGGRIYAGGSFGQPVQALALAGDRVLDVGADGEIRPLQGPNTQEMQLSGAAVTPGFYDAWVDVQALGRWQDGLDLRGAATPRGVQARVREVVARDDSDWIIGWGWDETVWPRPQLPTHQLLDAVAADRPILLIHHSGQLGWLNRAAMTRSGITRGSPTDGLLRDATGDLIGLVTGPGLDRVRAALPPIPASLRQDWIAKGLRAVVAAGITTVATAPVDLATVEILEAMADADELPVRVEIRLRPDAAAALAKAPGSRPLLRVAAVGMELDGPFGPRLAALLQPYADGATAPPPRASDVAGACASAVRLGVRIDFHAYGDAAVEAALGCEHLVSGNGLLVGADVVPASGHGEQLAPVAAVPLRIAHDLYYLDERLGADRIERAHPLRSLLAAGHLRAFASMAPSYALAPLTGFLVAWTRRDLQGYPLDGWTPRERVAVSDSAAVAIAATLTERPNGIDAGSPADLVVWSHDPFDGTEESLRHGQAMLTIVAGRVVYSRPSRQ